MDFKRIDLNRLSVFRAIVLSGSLSKAALHLGQPKSRISRHLAALEAELGSRLVYRTTRQFQLTPAGQDLFQTAIPLLNELEDKLERVTAGSEEVAGRLRVSVPDDVGTELMGTICRSFLVMYPKVSLEIHVSNEMVNLVRDSFDIALRVGKMRDSTLIQQKIGNVNLVPYLSPELRSKMGSPSAPGDLEKIPFLAFSPNLVSNRKALRLSNQREVRSIAVHSIFASNSFFVLRDLATEGMGFTVLPPFLAQDALSRGQLVPALREWVLEGSPVHTVIPNQKEVPARTRKFIEHLRKQLNSYI